MLRSTRQEIASRSRISLEILNSSKKWLPQGIEPASIYCTKHTEQPHPIHPNPKHIHRAYAPIFFWKQDISQRCKKESLLGSPQSPAVWTGLTRPKDFHPQSHLKLTFGPPHMTSCQLTSKSALPIVPYALSFVL